MEIGVDYLAWLAVLIPILSSPVPLILRKYGSRVVELFSIVSGLVTLGVSTMLILEYLGLGEERVVCPSIWPGVFSAAPFIKAELFVDFLSALMVFIVSFIGFLVIVFSLGYMHGDEGYGRYYAFILLFIGGMLGVVLAGNLVLLYLFWEIVGLCSCSLIAHWYDKPEASRAGIKAFIVTRVGDAMLLVGIALAYLNTGTLSYSQLPEAFARLPSSTLTLILLLSLGGAIGKSAQLPLHVWLPDAMEGPTTVSALIHAATMVKAGVYLVARLETLTVFYGHIASHSVFPFLETTAIIGAITALVAATMAVVSNDIKRVLAYSTISQLGYMFLGLGLAGFVESTHALFSGLYHLSSHAFFKALLFLSAGSIIHALETRDMRLMGGLWKRMPITSIGLLIGGLSLMGIPPLNGFWSKDAIIHLSMEALGENPLLAILSLTGALLTALYTARMFYYTILRPETDYVAKHHPHEAPIVMALPLIILSAMCFLSPISFMYISKALPEIGEIPLFHVEAITLITSLTMIGIGLGIFYSSYYIKSPSDIMKYKTVVVLRKVLEKGYYFDDFYNKVIVGGVVYGLAFILKVVDRALDGLNMGLALLTLALSAIAKGLDILIDRINDVIAISAIRAGLWMTKSHTGKIARYLTAFTLGLIIMLIIVVYGW